MEGIETGSRAVAAAAVRGFRGVPRLEGIET